MDRTVQDVRRPEGPETGLDVAWKYFLFIVGFGAIIGVLVAFWGGYISF